MAFPSGTATAQLISVLHDIPPPGNSRAPSSTIRRRGYSPLRTNAETEGLAEEAEENDADERDEEEEERQIVKKDGWTALISSFGLSAFITVSSVLEVDNIFRLTVLPVACIFLSSFVFYTTLWTLSSGNLALDIHT